MINKKEKGFTLVELLAVIVILAIILVIAVPKVMSVIEDSKKATLESTAKMIASAAEKAKVQNTVLGNNDEITCDSVAKINNLDYASCSITFDDNTAKVTIEGKGKFKGLNVCGGTKTSAEATNEFCELICEYGVADIVIPVKPYEVKDYDSCVNYLTNKYTSLGDTQEFIDDFVPSVCNGNGFNGYSTSDLFIGEIEEEGVYTEKELVENNVIKGTIEKGCLEPTPEECFAFDSEEGAITGYDISCGTDVVIPSKINNVTVTTIDEVAFRFREITSVVLPNSVEYIGGGAFSYNQITEINIPDSVEYIGSSAFSNNQITEINIPDSVEYIGSNAFYMNQITEINIPDSVEYIGSSAFVRNSLNNVYLGNVNAELGNCAFGYIYGYITNNLPDSYSCVD